MPDTESSQAKNPDRASKKNESRCREKRETLTTPRALLIVGGDGAVTVLGTLRGVRMCALTRCGKSRCGRRLTRLKAVGRRGAKGEIAVQRAQKVG